MRTRFDQFAKRVLAAYLAEAGTVDTEHEVSSELQSVDVWFVPSLDQVGGRRVRAQSVLGAMARRPALIEVFRCTPGVDDVLRCVGKQQAAHAELIRSDSRARLPMLWIVSAGHPHTALRRLGFRSLRRSGPGVYEAPPGFRLRVVVLSALPRTRRTLLLRLLGAGRTFLGALQELRVLPTDAWEVRVARPWLVRYQLEIRTLNRAERTAEEEAIMGAQDLYEQWEREILQRGKALGLDEGKALGLTEGLKEGKRELLLHVLTARFPELPAWVRERVQMAPEARLDAWAERVVSASCLEDVFGS
jgi:hypothetical protein